MEKAQAAGKVRAIDIKIECWFPLSGRDSKGEVMRDPVIGEIAAAHGKSAVQTIIRWHIQKGFSSAISR